MGLAGQTITSTNFAFPGQTAVYHGKVRDVYAINNDLLVTVATDRVSAFDVILPRGIPYKGQVLNQIAAHFLQATADVVPNWLMAVPDPNVSLGKKADPVKIEMVIRGYLVGHSWREYQRGKRELCGAKMPDGLQENDRFPEPIITPSTKADTGHDLDLTPDEIIHTNLATAAEWEELTDLTRRLFVRGQQMAEERDLVLVDTKYEFGRLDGKLILIDEVHTPDSSRYFYKDSYDKYIAGDKANPPTHLSKEFVREWLIANDFMGKDGQQVPQMTDEFVWQVSDRYVELYEQLTGEKFVKPEDGMNLKSRIEQNVTAALGEL
jgi:phosphoribosylaminoimidazole-succinocarboxamide synthase